MVKYLEIGQIVNTFGIKGQVKVIPFTDDLKRFDKLKQVYLDIKNKLELVEIEQVSYSKNAVILKIKGINTIEEANKYRNCYLKINRKDAKKLPKDTVIWVADYNDAVTASSAYHIWQYSRTGKSDSVESKYIDLNYWYSKKQKWGNTNEKSK